MGPGFSLGLITFADAAVFLIGLCLGSFGGMLASRIPREKAFTGRSQCPNCGHVLTPIELIPLVSFLLQRGRCKKCGQKISGAYFLVELTTAVSFVLFGRAFGYGVMGILNMVIALHLAVLAGTDMMHGLLPNTVILSGSVFALILRVAAPLLAVPGATGATGTTAMGGGLTVWLSLRDGLMAALAGFAFFYAVDLIKPGAMGGGDIKMAIFIGLYVGFRRLFPALGLGFVLSSLYAIPMMAMGKLKRTDTLPLGIYLSIATLIITLVNY